MTRPHCTSGFTLIELSIVIVIIALVAGGVMVGRELLAAAVIRSQVSQLESFSAAFNTFRVKYHCIPGDCPAASSFGLGTSNRDGNGDGKINCYYGAHAGGYWLGAVSNNREQLNTWYHLANANLISGQYAGMPMPSARPTQADGYWPNAAIENNYLYAFTIDCGTQAADLNPGNSFLIAQSMLHPTTSASDGFYRGLTTSQAYRIDAKIDDGIPITGRVLNADPNGAYPRPVVGATGSCNVVSGSTRIYNISGTGDVANTCSLAIGKAW